MTNGSNHLLEHLTVVSSNTWKNEHILFKNQSCKALLNTDLTFAVYFFNILLLFFDHTMQLAGS